MNDQIMYIPTTMEKFFGCAGEMVKPSEETVKSIVEKIPKGNLATIDQLREEISKNFKVQTACPASTIKALQTLSLKDKSVCYWRILKKKGELIAKYPEGIQGHAALLKQEGLEIDFKVKNPVVIDYERKLFNFI